MRLLHTSDWHLGHLLHEHSRELEHARFLEWLLDTIGSRRIDALIVAGDLFDTANPPAAAQAAWYRFVASARGRYPGLQMVFLAGNHDSAARLDAPAPVFDALGVHVAGALPRTPDGEPEFERLVFSLSDEHGRVAAQLAAVPFLRPCDLPYAPEGAEDPLVEGVRTVYARVLDAARRRLLPGQALVAAGHCYMANTVLSELSERKILGGNQHALPVDLFGNEVAYVALGHLHLAQTVGGQEHVRYSGSPLPLSLAEAAYRHTVLVVELAEGRLASVDAVDVPRTIPILRVPEHGPLPPEETLALLAGLPERDGATAGELLPYLEARVLLQRPDPGLRARVDETLEGKAVRLMRLAVEYSGHGRSLAETAPLRHLTDLTPDEVFSSCYHRRYSEPPAPALLEAFHELLDAVGQEGSE